jgi:hypothetical protein
MQFYFVRIGALAEVHVAAGAGGWQREARVIVRTSQGLQLGSVVAGCQPSLESPGDRQPGPQILRMATAEDELLIRRLERGKRQAVEKCRAALADSGSRSLLLDIDQSLDGGVVVMHFLGGVDAIAESITKTIAEEYETVIRSRHFAKLLRDGCGPDCGTDRGTSPEGESKQGGCGTGSCSGCGLAVACQDRG